MPGKKEARPATPVEYAIGVLAARSLPEKKLRERLAGRYTAAEVDAAVERLRELRMLDDAAWAERYTRDRFERLGKGRHRIRNELLTQGVAASVAEASIAAVFRDDAERAKAAAVLQSLRRRLDQKMGSDPISPDTDPRAAKMGSDPIFSNEAAPCGDSRASRFAAHADAHRASESLKNRLFRRMLARGYPATLVRDLLDVS
ncbi:MAG: regulatory protein RecX [Candidatus Binatia bacterium]